MDGAVEKTETCTYDDGGGDESDTSVSDSDSDSASGSTSDSTSSSSSSDDNGGRCCSPRIGNDFQIDELPHCTHDFFAAENAAFSAADDEEDQLAFALGRSSIPVTSIQKKPDPNRDPEEPNDGGDAAEERRRKGKKKRKGNWLTYRRMRARNDLIMEEVIVPGDCFSPWDETEEAAFVLGLYLFGKDFNALKRFLETGRKVTDLQHYYYSVFYGTQPYRRWVAARNNGSRRIVNGRHILVGWRQEELLRRLLPEIEESSRPELFETMAGFSKGEVPFERYVVRLRDIAGMDLLVDSVGLGCGKRDLTMGSVESVQPSGSTKRFELPPGKAFSDYTGTEMYRALSGGCRLSKSRAQDLFWEGVWPRLLAKGWSSEQSGKGPLVYMLPGSKRYSKRSSVKGKDFFDSISEVLNHVASDASLLELADLDNELLAKNQTGDTSGGRRSSGGGGGGEANGVGGERKRPMLWLSKGTSYAWKDDQADGDKVGETPKEKKVDTTPKKECTPSGGIKRSGFEAAVTGFLEQQPNRIENHCRIGSNVDGNIPDSKNNSDPRTESATETIRTTTTLAARFGLDLKPAPDCDRTRASIEEQALTRWRSSYHNLQPSRKRSYYDVFSDSINSALQLQGGVAAAAAAVGFSAQPARTKSFFLDNMIKHYLGNGKSVRLYGPKSDSKSGSKSDSSRQARANVAEVFYNRFQEAFHSHRKEIISLVVAVHLDWQRQKLAKSIAADELQSKRPIEELKLYEIPEVDATTSIAAANANPLTNCCCESKNLNRIEQSDAGDDDRLLVGTGCLRCSSRVESS